MSLTGTKSFKPYYSISGLSGLNGLGAVSADIQDMVDAYADNVSSLIDQLEKEARTTADKFTFDDNDLLYNRGITKEQKQAWVYYKRSKLNIPMLGGWKKYHLKGSSTQPFGTSDELNKLVKERAIFYSNGEYLPLPIFTWGNMYERARQLEADKDYIIGQWSEAVYLDHREAVNNAKPVQIRFNDEDEAKRATINSTSTLAKTFVIKEVQPDLLKEVADAEQFDHKGKRVKTDRRIELVFDGQQEYALREVFIKWLYTLDQRRYFVQTTPFEVSNFHVYGFPVSESYLEHSGKTNSAEIRQNAREEGEKLFQLFLLTALTPADVERLNDAFNEKYNAWADLNYAAIPIGLETSATFLNQGFAIRPEKREAIAFMEASGSGILAYDVGVGKTVSALLELANALHQGKCKRPVVIVPNPTYNNWIKEAMGGIDKDTGKAFSGVLTGLGYKVNDWYNLNTKIVERLDKTKSLEQLIPEGTITFMSYEGLRQMGFSSNVDSDFINQFKEILNQTVVDPTLQNGKSGMSGISKAEIADAAEQMGGLGKTARDEAKEEKDYEEILGLGNKNALADVDVLGFDYIIIDEAHRCKNVFAGVKADEEGKKNYLLTGQQSTTGIKAFFICNYIQRTFGRNVLLLTATPFTNSPLEVYSMLSLVGYDLLVESGYYNINDFFQQFAKVDVEYVVSISGDVKTKEIIKGFSNRKLLQKLIFTKINYKTGEDVGVKRPCKINLPMLSKRTAPQVNGLGNAQKLSTSDQVLTYLEMNDWQAENQEEIISRMQNALTPQNGKIDKRELFRAMSASLDNAFSPFLYKDAQRTPKNAKEFVDESVKIKYACECIRSVKEHHEAKGEQCSGQVIYSNRGVDYFYLIKEYLLSEVGFKRAVTFEGKKLDEVMIISGGEAKEKVDKETIKDAFNAGVVKVIIGSSTIREGINLQKTGTCLYDLYPDWNPTDVRQLEGRIWRQGNKFGYVRIVMPLVENSMDVFVFQKLEEKTSRINDLFYREGSSNMLDLDSIDPGEIKYALIKDINKLAVMDFAVERARAKNAIELLAEDAEAVKYLNDTIGDLADFRQNVVNDFRNHNLNQLRSYITRYADDSEMKDRVKVAQKLLADFETVVSNPVDEELARLLVRMENWNNRTGYNYNLHTWNLKNFVDTFRTVRKKEREVLKPKGFSLDNNFAEISTAIQKEFEEKNEQFVQQYGNSDKDFSKAPRYIELYDEIIRKKEALNINGQPVKNRVREFAALNYLLDYKAADVNPATCHLPVPGEKIVPGKTCPPVDSTGKNRIDADGLKLLSECIANEPNTKEVNTDPNTGRYTDSRLRLHDKLVSDVMNGKPCKVQNQPIAILTGGPPGSGKTTFLKKFAPWMDDSSKIVHIDADEIRAKLPEYKGWNSFNTHAETRDIVNRLLDNIGNPCEHDIIYDGTMNKADNYRPLIAKLRGMGYKIFVIYIQVPKAVSIERAMGRYQRGGATGRYVPVEVIDEVFERGLTAYEQIIKEADGYIRVDGIKQTIIEQGGLSLPKERNYEFAQEMSKTVVTKDKQSPLQRKDENSEGGRGMNKTLILARAKAKAILIKMKIANL